MTVNLWVVPAPSGPTYYAQDIEGYHNVTCTITSPDGHSDTFMPLDQSFKDSGHPDLLGETEAVGTLYFYYVPTQVGTYHITAAYPGEVRTTPGVEGSVYYKSSSGKTISFEVTEEKQIGGLLDGSPYAPLPTGYWQRPVYVDNREWSQISGDWLQINYNALGTRFNPYSTAPNAPHIVWTRQYTDGGIIGGDWGSISYPGNLGDPIIMDGKVYYNDPAGGTFNAVDLRTGELVNKVSGAINLGIHLRPVSVNPLTPQIHEANVAAMLWGTPRDAWYRYDPFTGALIQKITNVPTPDTHGRNWWIEGSSEVYLTQAYGYNATIPMKFAGEFLIKGDYYKVTNNVWRTGDGLGVGDGRLCCAVRF